jgi:hypothetical protein
MRMRLWPAIAAPAGLLFLFGLATWLFASKVDRDAEARDMANRRLESYARHEASEIAAAAVSAAGDFVTARVSARRQQEANLRMETRGVMDSLVRLLTATLEDNRRRSVNRRDNINFPSGFEGVRRFLEIMPRDSDDDPAKAALEANSPELASLLPAGFALTVVEDHAREMLALGGVTTGEGMLTASSTRELVFHDSKNERRWTLRLEVASPDQHPEPTAKEVAELLDRRFGSVRPDGMAWRGWLLGGGEEISASFPAEASIRGNAPPYLEPAGEWKLLDGGELVWLEKASAHGSMDWQIGVSVSIAAPLEEPTYFEALWQDTSWAATLGGLAVLAVFSLIWFVRGMLSSPLDAYPQIRAAEKAERRLVRDPAARRVVAEDEGVIVADVDAAGRVRVSAPPSAPAPVRAASAPAVMPKGSLARLQAMHRGKAVATGSRILDQARSPLLREMVKRVRPRPQGAAATPDATRVVARQATKNTIANMKQGTVSGWEKVSE